MPKANKIVVKQPGSVFNSVFPEFPTDRQLENCSWLWHRVIVTSVPPRDEVFDYERDMGATNVERVLLHQNMPNFDGRLTFYFPERHMSTQEEQVFSLHLQYHPQITNRDMTVVDIMTKSPLLIGGFLRDDIRIVKIVGDHFLNPAVNKISMSCSKLAIERKERNPGKV